MKNSSFMSAVILAVSIYSANAQSVYSPLTWGIDKGSSPSNVSANINNAFKSIGTLDTSTGVWAIPGSNISLQKNYTNQQTKPLSEIELTRYDASKWGVSTSAADNGVLISNAISDLSSSGGGALILPAGILNTSTTIILKQNVYLIGQGEGSTIIKLANSSNVDVVDSYNAYLWFGTTNSGFNNFGIKNLTIDGNSSYNSSGSCVAIYGRHFLMANLTIKNCYEYGLRTGYGGFDQDSMESEFTRITIQNAGKHGWLNNGPHDSEINDFTIIDAGQLANNTWSGMYIGTGGNGRYNAFHAWHTSLVTNRTNYAVYDQVGGSNFVNSHFEGSVSAALYIAGNLSQYGSTNTYYSSWGDNTPTVIVAGNNNIVNGDILGSLGVPGHPPRYGAQISGAGNVLNLISVGTVLGTVNFIPGEAYNNVTISGAIATGPGYLGTPSITDTVSIKIYGTTSNGSYFQIPSQTLINSVDPQIILGKNGSFRGSVKMNGLTSGSVTIKPIDSGSSDYYATIPDNTGTIAELNLEQNWTALQVFGKPIRLGYYTVGTLPTCDGSHQGDTVMVIDALGPTYNSAITAGGNNRIIALCDGTIWRAH